MEKLQLVNFIAKVMEESGFKVYKDFKTSQRIIDIYGVLPTLMGDFSVVVACKNYDKQWEVGIDILKEMEMVGRSLKASKVAIVTSSSFSAQSRNYASRKNIKLLDRDNLIILAKKFSKKGASLAEGNQENQHTDGFADGFNSNYSKSGENGFDNKNSYDAKDNPNNPNNFNNYGNNSYTNRNPSLNNSNSSKSERNIGYSNVRTPNDFNSNSGRHNSKFSNSNRHSSILNRHEKVEPGPPLMERLKPILSNTFVLIVMVVAISYLVSTLLTIVAGVSNGISGLVKIVLSLLLSFGLVFTLDKNGTAVLVKGTTVFFVSLIVLILMIILL